MKYVGLTLSLTRGKGGMTTMRDLCKGGKFKNDDLFMMEMTDA